MKLIFSTGRNEVLRGILFKRKTANKKKHFFCHAALQSLIFVYVCGNVVYFLLFLCVTSTKSISKPRPPLRLIDSCCNFSGLTPYFLFNEFHYCFSSFKSRRVRDDGSRKPLLVTVSRRGYAHDIFLLEMM